MVKLTVKTIKGKKFQIEVEQTQTVSLPRLMQWKCASTTGIQDSSHRSHSLPVPCWACRTWLVPCSIATPKHQCRACKCIGVPQPVPIALWCNLTIEQVREVKGVIEQQNAEFPAAQLKLIHSGQILKDDSTLAAYKIKEEEFLVCMVTKVTLVCVRVKM